MSHIRLNFCKFFFRMAVLFPDGHPSLAYCPLLHQFRSGSAFQVMIWRIPSSDAVIFRFQFAQSVISPLYCSATGFFRLLKAEYTDSLSEIYCTVFVVVKALVNWSLYIFPRENWAISLVGFPFFPKALLWISLRASKMDYFHLQNSNRSNRTWINSVKVASRSSKAWTYSSWRWCRRSLIATPRVTVDSILFSSITPVAIAAFYSRDYCHIRWHTRII